MKQHTLAVVALLDRRLVVIAVGALGIRMAAALSARDFLVQGDAFAFHQVAQGLADGRGFRSAVTGAPTAEYPPAWEVLLAAADFVGANGYFSHRVIGALLGTLTVVLIGLLGQAVASRGTGLLAAGIAAVYPLLWVTDVSLMSESLYGVLLVATLLAAHHRRPVALGVLLGLAALTRGEALALVFLLVVPLLWRERRALALAIGAFVLVLSPWTVRNLVTFDSPVLISNNANGIWTGANCPATYYGNLIGAWRFQCYTPARPGEDEAEYFARQRDEGLAYMRDNAERLPAVMVARLARLANVRDVDQAIFLDAQEGRLPEPTRWGIRIGWLVMLLAAAGFVVQRRRRGPLLVLGAPILMVVLVALATYGSTRFRYGAEPSLAVLAAIGLAAVVARLRTRITQFQVASSRSPGTRVMNDNRGQ